MTDPPVLLRRDFLTRSAGAVFGAVAVTASGRAEEEAARGQLPKTQSEEGVRCHKNVHMSDVMKGFPPPKGKRVTQENWSETAANIRYAHLHLETVFKSAPVGTANSPVWVLPRATMDADRLDRAEVLWGAKRENAEKISVADWLRRSETDALVVLHDGRIIAEQYFGEMTPATRHIIWCGGKSILATVLSRYLAAGLLKEEARATDYVPELASTGFRAATLRQLLDQTTCVRCREWIDSGVQPQPNGQVPKEWNYGTPEFRQASHDYARSARFLGMFPQLASEQTSGYYDLLLSLAATEDRSDGASFEYRDVNPMLLQMILERTTGKSYVELVGDLWRELGPEHDAVLMLDPIGTPLCCYGPAVTARDWARWGQMVCDRGRVGGGCVLPGMGELVDGIERDPGPDRLEGKWPTPMPNIGYRSLFWTASVDRVRKPILQAGGWCLQKCMIDTERRNVVVQFASFWDQDPEKLRRSETPGHGDLAMWTFVHEALPSLLGHPVATGQLPDGDSCWRAANRDRR